jgi:hypothetical protein
MSEIKSLADQLRSKIGKPDTPVPPEVPAEKKKEKKAAIIPPVIELLRAYDLADHKSMVHIRFENQTAQMLHHLKMATGVEVNKVVGYAVKQFMEQHPELKTIIKQHLQKLEL